MNPSPSQVLVDAFDAFNQRSRQLEHAYRALEGRVAVLTTELVRARAGHPHQPAETDAVQGVLDRQQRLGALGEMAAGLAHQIRTPLSAAMLYAAHLAKDELPAGDRARFSGRLLERLQHLERLVNDMLSFARGGQVDDEHFTVGELCDALQRSVEEQLQQAGAHWQVCNQAADASLCGNRDAVLGALGNLVVNALQASTTTPVLELQARLTGTGLVEIRLRDHGPGIPAGLRERIFEPFFTTRSGGTGLGLAVVKETVRAHQGRIAVQTPAGGGTEFIIQFPNAAATALPSGGRSRYLNAAAPGSAVCGVN
ncbi:MAG: HAMP domain-containing histidine kinase [Gammaproteobacteria bacterium]|nr:HAMP domain-containing histidine kinase [Gammaproteobacteria bacterium]